VAAGLTVGNCVSRHAGDVLALTYTSLLGGAAAYGVFFYNASKGNLTKLSSLTFLTPMFATFAGFLLLDETLTQWQVVGATVTLSGVLMMNFKLTADKEQ
jgi:drug/metabolite transporter (DMT)-like permease